MTKYSINKGIGKSVEFKGLKAQYLIILVVGLLAIFFLFVILYMLSVPESFCIAFGIISTSLLVFYTFRLNKKYGQYGLMKIAARKSRPHYLINRKPVRLFLNPKKK